MQDLRRRAGRALALPAGLDPDFNYQNMLLELMAVRKN
jgi:hypothetical protein